jgi:DNA polymerase-1
LFLQIHDELVVEVRQQDRDQAAALLKASMEGAWKLSVPLDVDVSVGPSWGEMEALEI